MSADPDNSHKRGRKPRSAALPDPLSIRDYAPLVDLLEVGKRTYVQTTVGRVDGQCRQVVTGLHNSSRFAGKSYSVKRITGFESKFGSDPIYLICIERKS